jgi:DNA-binding transcriptional LysR family regulator
VVAEDILLAVVTGDEAEALLVAEPLDCAIDTHRCTPTTLVFRIVGLRRCVGAHHPLIPDHSLMLETVQQRWLPEFIGSA